MAPPNLATNPRFIELKYWVECLKSTCELFRLTKGVDGATETIESLEHLNGTYLTFAMIRHSEARIAVLQVLRTFKAHEVIPDLCRTVLKKWKETVEGNKENQEVINGEKRQAEEDLVECVKRKRGLAITPPTAPAKQPIDLASLIASNTVYALTTSNSQSAFKPTPALRVSNELIRETAINQLSHALVLSKEDFNLVKTKVRNFRLLNRLQLSREIENRIFATVKGSHYKSKVNSKVANLKRNVDLKVKVMTGRITVSRFVHMNADEMATEGLKQFRDKVHNSSIPAVAELVENELVQCPKCKSKFCDYKQLQINRGDEPMTTNCNCYHCGFRWKFD
ncbi:Transcription elongation factor A protein 1 [Halotydeus destructor]|nr:Transcription elongation factor A protein 1 [Halotydeus destructor]